MYEDSNPIHKIDFNLNFFATSKMGQKYMPYLMILDVLHFPTNELTMILNKLVKDDCVARETITNAKSLEKSIDYRITFEGLLFYQQGGYEQELIRHRAENTRLDNIESSQRQFRRTQNVLLTLVAVGTLVAALYYSVELLNYLHCK
jgi:hypothetical protein